MAIKRKTTVLILAALAIVLAGVLFKFYLTRIRVYEFAGTIQKIEGNMVTLKGSYQSDKHPEVGGPQHELEAKVIITAQTKFTKIVLQMPSWAELAKTGGFFRPADMPRVKSEGSLKDVADTHVDGLFVKTAGNIYGKTQFEASEVTYYERTEPR